MGLVKITSWELVTREGAWLAGEVRTQPRVVSAKAKVPVRSQQAPYGGLRKALNVS